LSQIIIAYFSKKIASSKLLKPTKFVEVRNILNFLKMVVEVRYDKRNLNLYAFIVFLAVSSSIEWHYLAVIIYMKRNISTNSNLKENKNTNNSNRNKSPQRLVNGVKLYNFSEIESYKHINKPYLNEMKKEHIKNKLDLEKSTETRLAHRVKKNNMFISYARNPFMITNRRSKSQTVIQAEDQNNNRSIIDEINQLNTKRIRREIESKELDEVQFGA
jgi:hypothetical protein